MTCRLPPARVNIHRSSVKWEDKKWKIRTRKEERKKFKLDREKVYLIQKRQKYSKIMWNKFGVGFEGEHF
jgi:hypothetical protein